MPTLGTVSNYGWALNDITTYLSVQVTDLLSD